MDPLTIGSGYFSLNPKTLNDYLDGAECWLESVQFDTIVVTGLSGISFGTLLTQRMKKHLLIIRKDEETTHSTKIAAGTVGRDWIFVDDFVSSGATRRRVLDAMAKISRGHWSRKPEYNPHSPIVRPLNFVGTYEYTPRWWETSEQGLYFQESVNV